VTRAEWTRLFEAKSREEGKAENAGKVVRLDTKKRQLLIDNEVVDEWRKPNFF